MQIPAEPKVILRHCAEYDPEKIRRIIESGLEELDLRPHGRTLIKPNIVAAGPMFPHAYTRPELAEGVIMALKARDRDGRMSELAIGERCGITVPSRAAFDQSGYDALLARHPDVKRYLFDEVPQVEIRYTHKERLRDYVFTPEPIAKADFFVNLPKFKAHPWTTVTFSMKNYIGIQDDRHRLIDHDHRLNEKIADLQYIIQPRFIAIDAIIAGEGRMLTPKPFPMNLIIMGNSQVAIDAVSCHIIGLDPATIEHISLAAARGFGSLDLHTIKLSGDVSLEEAQKRARGFKVGLIRIEKYFEGTKISAYAGPPPEPERTDYCWGGCPGAFQEAIEVLRLYDAQCDDKLPRMHIVFGAYEGEIPAQPGEKVIFIGDCAQWRGQLAGNFVEIESLYRDRVSKDPLSAKHDDIFVKMASVTGRMWKAGGKSHVRLGGCPVSVAEQVLAVVQMSGVKNPYLDPKHAMPFQKSYLRWRASTTAQRLRGQPYQHHGPCHRGEAAPHVETREPKI
jgi:uncharacterized protein (DUF362 family)